MNFLKLLLHIGLIFTTAMTAYATEELENDSDPIMNDGAIHDSSLYNITLIHSNIRYIPNIKQKNVSFYGEYDVDIKIHIAMHHISAYLVGIKIDEPETKLIRNDNRVIYRPTNYTYNNVGIRSWFLLITFDEELSPGSYLLRMKFGGNTTRDRVNELQTSYVAKKGEIVWTNIMAVPLVTGHSTGMGLPCWGKRELQNTIGIFIKHHNSFKAVSHTPIIEQKKDKKGMVWTHFRTTPTISMCKVMVALFNYAHVHNANETINTWCRSNLTSRVKHAQNVAEKVKEYMTKYASISKNLPKIDQVVIPGFPLSGLPSLGIIFYNESDIAYDPTTDPTYRQMQVAKIVAHEVLRQWFGELVSPSQIDHMWLSEGLASFFEMYTSDKIFPNWRVIDSNVVHTLQGCLSEDTGLIMGPVNLGTHNIRASSKYTIFDEEFFEFSSYYDKAQVILRMLQHAVTNEVFRNGILTYLYTYYFSPADPDALWSAIEGTLKVSTVPFKDFEVKEVMDTWMNQRHYPLVIVTRNYETGRTIISQDDFRIPDIDFGPAKKWWVPITFATESNPTFYNTIPHSWLSPSKNEIYLETDPNDWIIVNVQQVGYYRVEYDARNWQKIIQTLNFEHTKIHVLNRAQIIDDAFVLRRRKQSTLYLTTFFELIRYLSRETDFIAWYPVFRNLAQMSKYFPLPESKFFTSQMADVFKKPFRDVWNEEDPNEDIFTKLKRLKISKWACLVDNLECKRMATAKLNYHLANIESHKLSYWWQSWTYCFGLMEANRTMWDRVMNLYMQKGDKNLLEHLACSENSDIIVNYLNNISSSNSTIQEEHRIFAFKHIIIKHARNNQVLDHILENFESVKPISIITAILLEDIISNVYTEAQLDKIKNNVKNGMHQEIFTEIQPIIEWRLNNIKNLIKIFSPWIMKEKGQA